MKKVISLILAISMMLPMIPIIATAEEKTETISYNYSYNAGSGYSDTAEHTRQMEKLDRGLVAVNTNNGIFLSWRLWDNEDIRYGSAESDVSFNVYRGTEKIATVTDTTNYTDKSGSTSSTYSVAPVINGVEGDKCESTTVLNNNYFDIPLTVPAAETIVQPDGTVQDIYSFFPADCSTGDLDGDGQYDIVIKWTSSERDVGSPGNPAYSGTVRLSAYKLDGTKLWDNDINLGKNVYSSAHTVQFLVYDFDLDGKSEVVTQTSLGSTDASGAYVSHVADPETYPDIYNLTDENNANADYRGDGRITTGEEFLTVFDGETGVAIDTITLPTSREVTEGDNGVSYGDIDGNRSNRFVADVAYLDGKKPYAVYLRGYYFGKVEFGRQRTSIAGISFDGERLSPDYKFDTEEGMPGYYDGAEIYVGNGNHNCTVVDVDSDGKDEFITGALCMEVKEDNSFKPRWCTFMEHGDALHIGDYDPTHLGFEFFTIHENVGPNTMSGQAVNINYGMSVIDADNGDIMIHMEGSDDTGRGVMADIGAGGYYQIGSARTASYKSNGGTNFEEISVSPGANFRIFWDGDLYDEILDATTVSNWTGNEVSAYFNASNYGVKKINGTKSNPALQADLFGDWREELVYPTTDGNSLRVFTTTDETKYKIKTLMHDPVYRCGIAAEQTGYNQPPHVGFYMGVEMFGEESTVTPAPTILPISTPTIAPTQKPSQNGKCGDDATWTLDEDGTLTISGTGDMYDYSNIDDALPEWYGEDVKSIIVNEGITSIGDFAFYFCDQVKSVSIADSIESIGGWSFSNCSRLTEVELPDNLISIGYSAFSGCSNLKSFNVNEPNKNFVSVDGVLFNKDKTTLVLCPDRKTGIYNIPNGVVSIEDYAFEDCTSLTEIIMPDTVKEIGYSCFENCDNLAKINISAQVTKIPSFALSYCEDLTQVTIPSSVKTIDNYAFSNSDAISEVIYLGTSDEWSSITINESNESLLKANIIYRIMVNYDYITNGGNGVNATYKIVEQGTNADLTPVASKDGYNFIGWNTDPNAHEALTSFEVNDNTTLYAIFKKELSTPIRFYSSNNELQDEISVLYNDESIYFPEPESMDSWKCVGWTADKDDCSAKYLVGEEIDTSNIKDYYAIYSRDIELSFNTRIDSKIEALTNVQYRNASGKTTGVTFIIPNAPINNNGEFQYWYLGDAEMLQFVPGDNITISESSTLEAVWMSSDCEISAVNGCEEAVIDNETLTVTNIRIPSHIENFELDIETTGSSTWNLYTSNMAAEAELNPVENGVVNLSEGETKNFFVRVNSSDKTNWKIYKIDIYRQKKSPTPEFSRQSGTVLTGSTLELSAENSTILYTVDGSNPTPENGMIYKKPIVIDKDMTVKAIAKEKNCDEYSDIVTNTYSLYVEKIQLEVVNESNEANEYSVEFNMKNDTENPIVGNAICALYDNDDTLVGISVHSFELEAESILNENIETKITTDKDVKYYKLFVWDSLDNMIPIVLQSKTGEFN